MSLRLEPLPYAENALEPHISARTVGFHYNKHHAGYLKKLENAIESTGWNECGLEEIVAGVSTDEKSVFRNAAQTWNHTFYWNSMMPSSQNESEPGPMIKEAIDGAFGSMDAFREAFSSVATGHFGSGWAWLVVDGSGSLSVTSTSDADNPLRHSQTPLLTLDVWEHAYYLDYQNERARYVDAFLDELINWRFAEQNLQVWHKMT